MDRFLPRETTRRGSTTAVQFVSKPFTTYFWLATDIRSTKVVSTHDTLNHSECFCAPQHWNCIWSVSIISFTSPFVRYMLIASFMPSRNAFKQHASFAFDCRIHSLDTSNTTRQFATFVISPQWTVSKKITTKSHQQLFIVVNVRAFSITRGRVRAVPHLRLGNLLRRNRAGVPRCNGILWHRLANRNVNAVDATTSSGHVTWTVTSPIDSGRPLSYQPPNLRSFRDIRKRTEADTHARRTSRKHFDRQPSWILSKSHISCQNYFR